MSRVRLFTKQLSRASSASVSEKFSTLSLLWSVVESPVTALLPTQ